MQPSSQRHTFRGMRPVLEVSVSALLGYLGGQHTWPMESSVKEKMEQGLQSRESS